jgi:hypothetical protein
MSKEPEVVCSTVFVLDSDEVDPIRKVEEKGNTDDEEQEREVGGDKSMMEKWNTGMIMR